MLEAIDYAIERAKMPEWKNKLEHMLGAGAGTKKRDHGYRNRYCADVGSVADDTMRDMVKAGFVEAGPVINNGNSQYYRATVKGCELIGLSKAAINRAMED